MTTPDPQGVSFEVAGSVIRLSPEEAALVVYYPQEWAVVGVTIRCNVLCGDVLVEQSVVERKLGKRTVYAAIFQLRTLPELPIPVFCSVIATHPQGLTPLPGMPPNTYMAEGFYELSRGSVTEIDGATLNILTKVDDDEDEEEVTREELGAASQNDYSLEPDTPHALVPADVVLGTDVETGEPVALPYQIRDLGVTVLGQTGYGKTTLLEQLILQDIEQGTTVIAIDAHGDLTRRILSLANTNEKNLLLLEVWEDAPFRLNLFECRDRTSTVAVDRTVSAAVQVFKRLFGSPREYYPRLERDLGNAARTVIANQGTLRDVPRLFWDDAFRAQALKQVTNRHVHEFWAQWERIGRAERRMEQLEATINRLDQFLSSEFVSQVVGSTTTTIPFDEVLDDKGRVLLLNLPVGEIGEGLCNLLGSLFLAVLTERIFARARLAPEKRPRVHLYLDEYGRYATPTTAQLLTEGRKFGIGTTVAHQTRAQIPDAENRAAELQVGALLCFQLIGEDAAELSGEFRVTPEPQREEPVEEIEGEEPELAIPPNPVEFLIKSGHPDPLVREAVRGFLAPLFRERDDVEQIKQNSRSQLFQLSPLANVDLPILEKARKTCDLVEKALADAMEQRIKDTPIAVLQVLYGYWPRLAQYFLPDLADSAGANLALTSSPLLQPVLLKYKLISKGSPEILQEKAHTFKCVKDFIKAANVIVVASGDPAGGPYEAKLAAELEKIFNWYRPHRPDQDPWTGVSVRRRNYYSGEIIEPSEPREGQQKWLNNFLTSLGRFVYPLLILLHRLASQPLLVPTGRFRPRKRLHYITYPQRSYQDVQNELAVELASLPRFTTYTSVQGEQHRVTLSVPAPGDLDEERIEHIKRESRARFGRLPISVPPETLPSTPGPQTPAPKRQVQEKKDDDTVPTRRDYR